MAELNAKFKQILNDLEENLQSKDDLEYVKTQMFKLYNLFFDEISRIEETVATKMETIVGTQSILQEKVENIENKVKTMEKEFFLDDESDFSITCPYCNNEFIAEYDELNDEIQCPECNNIIELDWGEEDEENKGCSGNCKGCTHHNEEDEDM